MEHNKKNHLYFLQNITMNIQKDLFEIIKAKISAQFKLADVLCDILEVSSDSAYRRIRGEKELSASELGKLCNHFGISVDAILNRSDNNVIFRYTPLDVTDINNYVRYMQQLASTIETLSTTNSQEIIFAAEDIPMFHFMPFPELIFFKLYAWHSSVCNTYDTYEEFVGKLEQKEVLMNCYKSIENSYNRIPSAEVWTIDTIEPILRLLDYYHEMDSFTDKETPVLLCTQLLEMINRVAKYTEDQAKEVGAFRLHLSPVNPENSFMLVKSKEQLSVTIKLFTINSIMTSNQTFCKETLKWIDNIIVKSTLISGTSARERFRFFQSMKNKVNILLGKVQKMSTIETNPF